jgi:hypothetical protein
MTQSGLVGEWQALDAQARIDELMGLFGNFHDSCVREIHIATGHCVDSNLSMHLDWRTSVHLLVQRQYAETSAVELRFEEVVGLHVSQSHEPGDFTWVAARKSSWRDASKWLGPDLRYPEQPH